jgi:hypothetical protein
LYGHIEGTGKERSEKNNLKVKPENVEMADHSIGS